MGLETGTYISDLNASNPVGASDPKSQGDDHLRLIKSVILATFPSIAGAVTLDHDEINDAALQSQKNLFTVEQRLVSSAPSVVWEQTSGAADAKIWRVRVSSETWKLQLMDDTETSVNNGIEVSRSGYDVTTVQFEATDINVVGILNILDAGETDAMTIQHNGTSAIFNFTNTDLLYIQDIGRVRVSAVGSGGHLEIRTDVADLVIIRPNNDTGADLLFDIVNDRWHSDVDFHAAGDLLTDSDLTVAGNLTVAGKAAISTGLRVTGLQLAESGASGVGIGSSNTTGLTTGMHAWRNTASNRWFNGLAGSAAVGGMAANDFVTVQLVGSGNFVLQTAVGVAAVTVSPAGEVTTPNTSAKEFGYKGTPQRSIAIDNTLTLVDAGTRIYMTGGASKTLTIPANGAVAFPIGTIIVMTNDSGNDWSIAITTDTLEKYGGSTGTQTLGDNQKAIVEKVTATLWKYASTD